MPGHRPIAARNISSISGDGVQVLLTRARLISRGGTRARGLHLPNVGVIINKTLAGEQTLAHELGHVADWKAPETGNEHSDDSGNVMHGPSGAEPDCQWCRKVSDL
jgi:hypothetical protein